VTDLVRELEALREQLVPAWGPVRGQHVFAGIARLRTRRRAQSAATWACSAALVCASALYFVSPRMQLSAAPASPPSAAGSAPRELQGAGSHARMLDGSELRITSPDGALSVEVDEPLRAALRLRSGAAHFEVEPQPQRSFLVAAGACEILVVGTAFDVAVQGERVRVAVSHGSVRVRGPAGESFVRAGESRWFEPLSAVHEPMVEAVAPPAAGKPRAKHSRELSKPESDWRSASLSGDYERAQRMLMQGALVEDTAEALLDAADAARFSNHPEEAAGYLRRALTRHRDSPVCALAAFTLGRVLLERLGQPAEAAEAFAQARERARDASLAEDALAREVEAWSKAGHANLAYDRAQRFLQRYPHSRRLRVVELHGGLRAPVVEH
jgi:transmembrane sensor